MSIWTGLILVVIIVGVVLFLTSLHRRRVKILWENYWESDGKEMNRKFAEIALTPTPFAEYVLSKNKWRRYDHRIQEAVAMIENFPVDWRIIKALIKVESDFRPDALSYKGAMGLMQLMPDTATELRVKDVFNPTENILGGVKYFMWLWERWDCIGKFNTRLEYTLASYNAGHSYINAALFNDWNLTATWVYVDKVLKWYKIYKEKDK